MILKKLLPTLVQAIVEAGFDVNATEIQSISMPKIKSGADAFIIAPAESGKTTALVMSIIQKLKTAEGEAPRAIVLVKSREDVFAMEELFKKLGRYTNLRFMGVFDQGVIQYQKDMIYEGIDLLIGTPKRVNELMSITGIPLSAVKTFAVDDAETFFPNRTYPVIYRVAEASPKAQFLIFANKWIDNFELLSEQMMKNTVHVEIE